MIPSCDQTGVPLHFHSSTTPGSASLMSLRIRASVSPCQSPSSAILLSISLDADAFALEGDFFTVLRRDDAGRLEDLAISRDLGLHCRRELFGGAGRGL